MLWGLSVMLWGLCVSDINSDAVGFVSADSFLELEVAQDDSFFDPNTVTFSFRTFHQRGSSTRLHIRHLQQLPSGKDPAMFLFGEII